MIADSPRQFEARQTLERLKRGVPPTENIAELTVGMERLRGKLSRLLSPEPEQRWFFVVSEYGEGKSHFHCYSKDQALKSGYAVASLDINKDESAIHQPQRHLSVVLNSLVSPLADYSSHQGIVELMRHWLETESSGKIETILNELRRISPQTPAGRDPDNLFWLVECYLNDRTKGVNIQYSLQRLIQFFSCEDLNSKSSYARFAASFRLQVIERWLSRIGHGGLFLFVDEVDNVLRQIHGKGHPACFRSLAWYCSSAAFKQTRVVFASTPDVIQMLSNQMSHFKSNLKTQATVRKEEVQAFSNWGNEFAHHLPYHHLRCPKLSAALRKELLGRIVELHGRAWGAIEFEDKLGVLSAINCENPRRWMRSIIHVLDTVQQSLCNGQCNPRKPR